MGTRERGNEKPWSGVRARAELAEPAGLSAYKAILHGRWFVDSKGIRQLEWAAERTRTSAQIPTLFRRDEAHRKRMGQKN